MKKILNSLSGDKGIWSFVALLALFSFMPVFSASSNLAYMNHGTGNTLSYLLKHLLHMFFGFVIMYNVQKVPYHYWRRSHYFLLPISWLLLVLASFIGVEQGSASRWIKLPFVGLTFQPSAIAFIILMIYVAQFLSKPPSPEDKKFWPLFLKLWIPVGVTLMLILPNNFSTAALIFAMVLMLTFVGNYPIRNLLLVVGIAVAFFAAFIMTAKVIEKTNPENMPRLFKRVKTWENRVANFSKEEADATDEDYQIEQAKTAIATGGIYGLGPGKSVQKNFLPQSSSDFIFAIIIEEYGLVGGFLVIGLYLLLFIRFIVASQKANSMFGKLLIVGLGFPIIFQAMINMAVAVQLLPVTGQTLPLISSGGSSVWMICISIGIIIGVTKKDEEIARELADKEQREIALQKLIDKQMEEDAHEGNSEFEDSESNGYSIKESKSNPMNAVRNK